MIDLGNGDPGALARKQDRGGAADAATGASDEGYLACEPRHRFLLLDVAAGEETAHLAGNGAIAIRTDVTDPDSLQSAIRATVDTFGRLDILHNNAGGSTAQVDRAGQEAGDRQNLAGDHSGFVACEIEGGAGDVVRLDSGVTIS